LVFESLDDRKLPLRGRMERYISSHLNMLPMVKKKSEVQIFMIAIYSYISQVIDIILICSILRINPYIRNEITFNYFLLIRHSFTEDKNLKRMIERTLLFYIFYRTIKHEQFADISFPEYCKKIENKHLLQKVIDEVHSMGIDISEGGIKQVTNIIRKEYELVFQR
jgi:hypothetical protein